MNKVIYVSSYGKPIGKNVTKKVSTGETKKDFFGDEQQITKKVTEWEQTGCSDCQIDGERLSKDIQLAIEQLNNDGYEVVTVTSITSGNYNYKTTGTGHHGDSGYGYGYSYTEGVTIIGKK